MYHGDGTITVYGVLNARLTDGSKFIFSSMWNVEADLGALRLY